MTDPAPASTAPMLERRRVEAAILKHVYDTLKASHGDVVARSRRRRRAPLVDRAGRRVRAPVGGKTSIQTFIDRQELWTRGGALETEVSRRATPNTASTSRAAGTPRCIATWGWARSATSCPASATAPSARATTSVSPSSARRPSCRAPATATSTTPTTIWRQGCQGVTTQTFAPGGYRFIPGLFQYSGGAAAEPGYAIERVTFRTPVPLVQGFKRVEEIIKARGRPLTAFCACELRSPAPFTDEGFRAFNEVYVTTLAQWGIYDDKTKVNPVARSNVCPEQHKPSEPSFHAFSSRLHRPPRRRPSSSPAAARPRGWRQLPRAHRPPRRDQPRRAAGEGSFRPGRDGATDETAGLRLGPHHRHAGLHGARPASLPRRRDRAPWCGACRPHLALRPAAGAGPRVRDGLPRGGRGAFRIGAGTRGRTPRLEQLFARVKGLTPFASAILQRHRSCSRSWCSNVARTHRQAGNTPGGAWHRRGGRASVSNVSGLLRGGALGPVSGDTQCHFRWVQPQGQSRRAGLR